MKLSLCMIVLNEEEFLGNCLKQVKEYVDEIIVVDTGSKDKTLDIAKKHHAQVFHFTWSDDFSAARNEAISHATGDWIMVLDADERIAPEDLLKIRQLILSADFQGISLVQRNYTRNPTIYSWVAASGPYAQGFPGYFTTRICRVFQNKPHIRFRYKVHELVEESIFEKNGIIVRTDIPIHHYGAAKGQKGKPEKYLALALAQIKETPENPKAYYEAAELYREQKKLDLALALFQKAAALDENFGKGYAPVSTCIGDVYVELGKLKEAKELYEKSIARTQDINALVNLGVVHDKMGKEKDAAKCFEQALAREPRFVQAYNNLYALLLKTKRYLAAYRLLHLAGEKTGLPDFFQKKEILRKKLVPVVEKELKEKPTNAQLLAARRELLG